MNTSSQNIISLKLLQLAAILGLSTGLSACGNGHGSSTDVYFFSANDNTHSSELWKTDGTTDGTVMVKDIYIDGPSGPYGFISFNGTTYFSANDGIHGRELWKTDGTESGTIMVKDIHTSGDSSIQDFTTYNEELYFYAENSDGAGLWKTDGTSAGTILVTNISGNGFTVFNGEIYFSGSDNGTNIGLWKTNGTPSGTIFIKNVNPSCWCFNSEKLLVEFKGELYFTANDINYGFELWKTDGTSDGTIMVKDINPNGDSDPGFLTVLNDELFFIANDGNHGIELWKTNGAENGTIMVKDINTSDYSFPLYLTAFNGSLYFSANDGIHGNELWKSNGTESGTMLVKDIDTNNTSTLYGSYPANISESFVEFKGDLYFDAGDREHGSELWKTNGTEAGTIMVKDINTATDLSVTGTDNSYPRVLTTLCNTLLFNAGASETGYELWKTDGTVSGTSIIKDIWDGFMGAFSIPN
ncbi:MAG: hypothetical protein HYZ31_08685 [Gammaproteobacteria bacterium]|nr:hypothetical protein [Gammaproteobacteria bacterium]